MPSSSPESPLRIWRTSSVRSRTASCPLVRGDADPGRISLYEHLRTDGSALRNDSPAWMTVPLGGRQSPPVCARHGDEDPRGKEPARLHSFHPGRNDANQAARPAAAGSGEARGAAAALRHRQTRDEHPGPARRLPKGPGPAAVAGPLPGERPRRRGRRFGQGRPQLLPGGRGRREHHRIHPAALEAVLTWCRGDRDPFSALTNARARLRPRRAAGPIMRDSVAIENIEALRRLEGIDDVELREEIRGLEIGDRVNLTLVAGGKAPAGETLLGRVTRIRGPPFRGKLATQPAPPRPSQPRVGAARAFTP